MKTGIKYLLLALIIFPGLVFPQSHSKGNTFGLLNITFENTIDHNPIVLNDSTYTNPFNEKYTISKLRYYISNVKVNTQSGQVKEKNSYHLIDESKPISKRFAIPLQAGKYQSITFMIGVDSMRNISGAQTGALDPLNDMFWTWNTGYVMAKMEGHSPSSPLANNLFEYHIAGFSGTNSVLKTITLEFPLGEPITMVAGLRVEMVIEADINKMWNGSRDIKIATQPSITSQGELAKAMSDNYSKMFIVQQVTEPTK